MKNSLILTLPGASDGPYESSRLTDNGRAQMASVADKLLEENIVPARMYYAQGPKYVLDSLNTLSHVFGRAGRIVPAEPAVWLRESNALVKAPWDLPLSERESPILLLTHGSNIRHMLQMMHKAQGLTAHEFQPGETFVVEQEMAALQWKKPERLDVKHFTPPAAK
jgi:broad specificity phosphatase PhoE